MRFTIRLILIIASFISISVLTLTFFPDISAINLGNSATISASLAVLAAIVSAWGAIKIVEQSEDSQKPYPYPSFDVESRYSLIQLVIKNYGGSPAYNIKVIFDKPILDSEGTQVRFSDSEEISDAAILLQNEHVSVLVDASHKIFPKYNDLNFSGNITFENSSGKKTKNRFTISLEQYRKTLAHSNENLKTSYELQKLPKVLKEISNELNEIKVLLKEKDRLKH